MQNESHSHKSTGLNAEGAPSAAIARRSPHVELRGLLQAAGCFERTPWAHAAYIAAIAAIGAGAFVALLLSPDPGMRIALLGLLAFANVQAGFIAHEVGHGAVTGNRAWAEVLERALFTVASGVSSSYLRHIHRIHHAHLNEPAAHGYNPPPSLSAHGGSTLNQLVRHGRAWLVGLLVCAKTISYRLSSLAYVWRNRRTTQLDQIALALHCVLWIVLPMWLIGVGDAVINYLLLTLLAGPYIGTVLLLSHTGMETFGPEDKVPSFSGNFARPATLAHH